MRIAFFDCIPPYDPAAGGIASVIQHRACVLGRLGFEVWWANAQSVARWSPGENQWVDRNFFGVSRFKSRLLGRWPALSPTWHYLAVEKAVDIFELQAGLNGWLPFHANGPRIVLNCHTASMTRAFLNRAHEVERHTALFKRWACRNLRLAEGILAPSNEIAMLEAGYFHLHPDRITVLPHVFSLDAEPGLKLRNDTGGNGAFLVIGNVEHIKALDLIAAGFAEYLRNGGVGRLQIVGCAGLHELWRPSSTSAIKPAVEKLVADHGSQKIQFLGKLKKDELARCRAAATAIICGSRFESFSMVAGEAFLSGCPLILSERTGLHALAGRYRAARLINPYDPKDIAAAMREMEDPEKRKEYQRGGDKLADYLTAPELAEKTASFYRQIVA
jgi:glycosyltransferase involved in cell wall biosynthesis